MVVDQGVDEESEEVFNDIGQLVRGEVVHDPEESQCLLFEEIVDVLGSCGVDEFRPGSEFAEDGICGPEKATLARVLEAAG